MKKFHVFFTIIAFVLILLSHISCKKDRIPKVDGKDTVYYTATVYVDSLVMYDAIYIDTTKWIDTAKYYNQINSGEFLYSNVYQKLIIDSLNNKSIRYLGGFMDIPDDSEPVSSTISSVPPIDTNIVAIPVDTEYVASTIPYNYAILEIKEADKITIDTAFFDNKGVVVDSHLSIGDYLNCQSDINEFLNVWTYNFEKDSLATNGFLSDFDTIPLNIGNHKIYMFDIFSDLHADCESSIIFYSN